MSAYDDDEVYVRPVGPAWLVRREPRALRTLKLRAIARADRAEAAAHPDARLDSAPDRFGVSLPRLKFLAPVAPRRPGD